LAESAVEPAPPRANGWINQPEWVSSRRTPHLDRFGPLARRPTADIARSCKPGQYHHVQMPWNLVVSALALALLVVAWLFGRRLPRTIHGPMPNVGQAPSDAAPVAIPRMQDIGLGSYELPLSDPIERAPD